MVELNGFEKLLTRVNEEAEWRGDRFCWVKKKILKEFDPATGELHSILSADDEGRILEALATLRPREEKVLKMRFGIGGQKEHILKEIGEEFGVSRSMAGQIVARALRKLRYRNKKLPPITRKGIEESYREAFIVLNAEMEQLRKVVSLEHPKHDQGFPAPFLSKSMEADLAKPIGSLELSVRVHNCFVAAQPPIETIGDLVHSTEGRLLRLKRFGRKSLTEVKKTLSEMGLGLGMKV